MRSLVVRLVSSIVAVSALAAPVGATTMVKRLALEEVAGEAVRIVRGTVTAVRSGRDDSGAPATWVTLAVTQTVKGQVGTELTIKQFGASEPLPDGAVTRIAAMPRYTVGEEVVLFLRADSAHGFTSPVGLEQGVYRVRNGMVRSTARAGGESLDAFMAKIARLSTWPK